MRAHLGDYKEPLHRRLPPRAVLLDRAAVSRPWAHPVAHGRRDETSGRELDPKLGRQRSSEARGRRPGHGSRLRSPRSRRHLPSSASVRRGGAARRGDDTRGTRAGLPAGTQSRRRPQCGASRPRARRRLHVLPRPPQRPAAGSSGRAICWSRSRSAKSTGCSPTSCDLSARHARPGDRTRADRRGARQRARDRLPPGGDALPRARRARARGSRRGRRGNAPLGRGNDGGDRGRSSGRTVRRAHLLPPDRRL